MMQEGEKKSSKKAAREFDWSSATFGHYVLKIAYVGTPYHGLAVQASPKCITVELKLFEALVKTRLVRDRQSCGYSRCGRTDKGVHAAGNYVALQLRQDPGGGEFDYVSRINAVLPPDIRILAVALAPEGFDARFSCLYRCYRYYFPLRGESLDRMRTAAQSYLGEHDFRNFCKMDVESVTNYRRRMLCVSVERLTPEIGEFAVTGVAFLWHQVRCMVAVLLLVGQGLEEPSIVQELLDVETHPCRPNYEPADESGLVLRDCGFEGLPFAPGWPPPGAGPDVGPPSRGRGDVPALASLPPAPAAVVEGFRQSQAQANRIAAVHACLTAAAEGGRVSANCAADLEPGGTGAPAAETLPLPSRRAHVPLMKRARLPSLEEKLQALDVKRQRKAADGATEAMDTGGDE